MGSYYCRKSLPFLRKPAEKFLSFVTILSYFLLIIWKKICYKVACHDTMSYVICHDSILYHLFSMVLLNSEHKYFFCQIIKSKTLKINKNCCFRLYGRYKFTKQVLRGWSSHFKGFSIANCRKSTNRWTNFYLSLIYLNKNLAS